MEYLKSLNKEQYEAATTIDGRVFILAGAGSGKTSVLMARTHYMLDNDIKPENILLLTYTKNAADEMSTRLMAAVGPDAKKVVVKTFHGFCMRVLYAYGKLIGFPYDVKILSSAESMEAIEYCKNKYIEEAKEEVIKELLKKEREIAKAEKKKAKKKNQKGKSKKKSTIKTKEKAEDIAETIKTETIIDLKDFPTKSKIFDVYSESVERCVTIDSITKDHKHGKAIRKIINLYKAYKKEKHVIDYEDMLQMVAFHLAATPSFKEAINNQFKYVSCDEYQDTNIIQNKILDYITEKNNNLAVVGDDNQSIYAFRFANIENILGFQDRYPNCKKIVLNRNYRSSQEILDFSNVMMEYAPEGIKKTLLGGFHGDKPALICCKNEFAEAEYIVKKIAKMHKMGYDLSDFAVLCRNGFQSYIIESELSGADIPFKKFGGKKFIEKSLIRDLLAFLRLSESEMNEIALMTVLKQYPGVGIYRAQACAESIMNHGFDGINEYKKKSYYCYLVEFVNEIKFLSGLPFEQRVTNLCKYYIDLKYRIIDKKKISDAKKSEEYAMLSEALSDIEIFQNLSYRFNDTKTFIDNIGTESTTPDAEDFVNVSTIHSSKGLEYKIVFILDCVNGIFPAGDVNYPEELRCMYVAATRAKSQLYIMAPYEYTLFNKKCDLSPFIKHERILSTLTPEILSA